MWRQEKRPSPASRTTEVAGRESASAGGAAYPVDGPRRAETARQALSHRLRRPRGGRRVAARATAGVARPRPSLVHPALQDRSFVDADLRDTESDLLYSIKRKAGAPPAWLYVLLEHQSRPDRWIRFRLLKYCCRIWDRSRVQFPRERRLRPIVPLVFYQGPGRWRHATEFAELFADSVRDWPWVPRFAHLLIDQSRVRPHAVRGLLQGRIAQLMMMARYRHRRLALQRAVHLLAELLPQADRDAVRTLVVYLWATQDPDTARQFGEELRATVPGP